MLVENCRLIHFPRVGDDRGNLTFIEAERHVPFEVKRVFCLYDVPAGQTRGAHAHKELHQVLVSLAGSFEVLVEDGLGNRRFLLNEPTTGLYVPPLIWDTEINFSPGAVCMVLASEYYDESDYYRDYDVYLRAVAAARRPAGLQVSAQGCT
jgi:oxalate decarboxylase/phosphoglucose isomerase-like protein (cupin superfamily)